MPRIPVRLTATPLVDCWLEVDEPPPKFRPALSAPIETVTSSMPFLKPMFSIPIVGPWRLSGPSEIVLALVAPPGAEA